MDPQTYTAYLCTMTDDLCHKILVVEDEPTLRLALQDALGAEGCKVHTADNGNDGYALFQLHRHDIVLTDMVMPGLNGVELIEKIMELKPETRVFAFTAYGNVDTAVHAMKLGALDFITKPFRITDLVDRIRREMEEDRRALLRDENSQESSEYRFGQLIGRSRQMQEVYDLIETVAASDANILIVGESGTGKELAASALHFNSPRRDRPFIKVSCASLSETLLESELFGHEKGSFTGALHQKTGRFEQAHGGTLFLDEIGDISETVQIKLLRVLQEREFERVGGTETIHVDVRIVCATNQDIERLVERSLFREDLYYRINTVTIRLPNLSERSEDIRMLADHFREIHNRRIGNDVAGFSEEAYRALEQYGWPGNVRELKNAVERAVLLTRRDAIGLEDLPEALRRDGEMLEHGTRGRAAKKPQKSLPVEPLEKAMARAEESHIRRALEQTGFNRTRAAELLGISRKTLWEKMRGYSIEDER
ncbi:response regulator [bacterium]|nr:response regulator [bacterium]